LSPAPARHPDSTALPPPQAPASTAALPEKQTARPADNGPEPGPPGATGSQAGTALKDAFLSAIEKKRPMVYGTIVAQAQRVDVEGGRIVFRYGPTQTMLGDGVSRERAWLEELAAGLAGRRISVVADVAKGEPVASPARPGMRTPVPAGSARDLKAEAMKDPLLQSLLDVIPAEVKDITELE
jgi:hypothetical protein